MSQVLWNSLPTEIKLAAIGALDSCTIKIFATVDKHTHILCVPTLFKHIRLLSFESLQSFLAQIPPQYYHHIRHLQVCTKSTSDVSSGFYGITHPRTDALVSLLDACALLEELSLQLVNSLSKTIIPSFLHLSKLKRLHISNLESEDKVPISERLVVSIAASIPCLEQLSLYRITRSQMHAPEFQGIHPYVPLVMHDHDIDDHPFLGSQLSLPSLLRIPTLKTLKIQDTHLGDQKWSTMPVDCHLEMIDLGGFYLESDDFNRICIERIMAAVGPTIDEFSLATAVSDTVFTRPQVTPLKRLRKLHITPFFPLENMVETMSTLAGSPIETVSMQCFEDDVVDVCTNLEEFLNLRAQREPEFYQNLKQIDVSVTASAPTRNAAKLEEERAERAEATKRLQEFCTELKLGSPFGDGH